MVELQIERDGNRLRNVVDLEITQHGNRLTLVGELDIYTCPQLKSAVQDLLDAGQTTIEVDMAGVTYIDSAGLGVLVGRNRTARAVGGEVVILRPHPFVADVLDRTRLNRVFRVEAEAKVARLRRRLGLEG